MTKPDSPVQHNQSNDGISRRMFLETAGAAGLAGRVDLAGPASNLDRFPAGDAAFHLAWGLILTESGEGLWPGFDRSRLAMPFWGGLEHLTRSLAIDPECLEALIAAAELLDGHGQEAFSRPLWLKAADLEPEDEYIAARLARAEHLSYWSR